MNKQKALRIVNVVLAIDFLLVALAGIFRAFIPYELFYRAHPIGGYLLAALVAVHVYLNWTWIKQNFLKNAKKTPPTAKS